MNWNQEISLAERISVEKLISDFENYLKEVHGSGDREDNEIFQKWRNFKTVIVNNPNDPQKLLEYLDSLSLDSTRTLVNKEKIHSHIRNGQTKNEARRRKFQGIQIDKDQLKNSTRMLLSAITFNTRKIMNS